MLCKACNHELDYHGVQGDDITSTLCNHCQRLPRLDIEATTDNPQVKRLIKALPCGNDLLCGIIFDFLDGIVFIYQGDYLDGWRQLRKIEFAFWTSEDILDGSLSGIYRIADGYQLTLTIPLNARIGVDKHPIPDPPLPPDRPGGIPMMAVRARYYNQINAKPSLIDRFLNWIGVK